MDYFYVSDSIMVAIDRKEGKKQRCKDMFLIFEDFINHWARQILNYQVERSAHGSRQGQRSLYREVYFDLSSEERITRNSLQARKKYQLKIVFQQKGKLQDNSYYFLFFKLIKNSLQKT